MDATVKPWRVGWGWLKNKNLAPNPHGLTTGSIAARLPAIRFAKCPPPLLTARAHPLISRFHFFNGDCSCLTRTLHILRLAGVTHAGKA